MLEACSLPNVYAQRSKHSPGGVLTQAHMLRTFALQQLLLATNLRLPASLDSALTPSLASWPPALASAQKPHDSDLDPLLHGRFQRHLAASSIKNSDWHSKPWEIRPFNPPGCPPPPPTPASTPHPSTPHFSPSLQCFSSIFLQSNPPLCYKDHYFTNTFRDVPDRRGAWWF